MKIEVQDWGKAADEVGNLVTEFKQDVSEGFARVDNQVVDQFKNEQLSGRKPDDTGLNIKTGTLHGSINSRVEVADSQIAGVVYNGGATYWAYHQYGEGNNPKRLEFDEYFQTEGLAAYTEVVDASLHRMVA